MVTMLYHRFRLMGTKLTIGKTMRYEGENANGIFIANAKLQLSDGKRSNTMFKARADDDDDGEETQTKRHLAATSEHSCIPKSTNNSYMMRSFLCLLKTFRL